MVCDILKRGAVEDHYLSPARLDNAEISQLIYLSAYDDARRAEAVCYFLVSYKNCIRFNSAAFFFFFSRNTGPQVIKYVVGYVVEYPLRRL